MFWCEDYAEGLAVSAAVSDELAVEASEHIFGRIVGDGCEDVGVEVFGEVAQWRFAESVVLFRKMRTVGNERKLIEHPLLLHLRLHLNAVEVGGEGIEDFLSVGVHFVGRQILGTKIVLAQSQQNGRDHKRLLGVAQLTVGA